MVESWYIALRTQGLPNLFKLFVFSIYVLKTNDKLAIFTRFRMGPSVEMMLAICSNSSTPLNKMAAMHIW